MRNKGSQADGEERHRTDEARIRDGQGAGDEREVGEERAGERIAGSGADQNGGNADGGAIGEVSGRARKRTRAGGHAAPTVQVGRTRGSAAPAADLPCVSSTAADPSVMRAVGLLDGVRVAGHSRDGESLDRSATIAPIRRTPRERPLVHGDPPRSGNTVPGIRAQRFTISPGAGYRVIGGTGRCGCGMGGTRGRARRRRCVVRAGR